jgi:NADH-quinone oxidoreductase subunit M
VILSAAYALYLYRRVIFGALVKPSLQAIQDLSGREVAILAPLVVVTVLLGVYPKPVLDVTTPSVAKLISDNKASLALEHEKRLAQAIRGAAR